MIPGMNPRQMKQAMKRMGIQQEDLEVDEIIMKIGDKELVFKEPQVAKVNMMGQDTYQVVGEPVEREIKEEISEEDIKNLRRSRRRLFKYLHEQLNHTEYLYRTTDLMRRITNRESKKLNLWR